MDKADSWAAEGHFEWAFLSSVFFWDADSEIDSTETQRR